jgi:hypothetical protein
MPYVLKATPGANLLEGGYFDVSRILETWKMKGIKFVEFQKGKKTIFPSHSSALLASTISTKSSITCPRAAA